MKINKKKFENKNFRVLGKILCNNCISIKKFQFTSFGGRWHGMALPVKACTHYFSLFLKKQCVSWLF